MEEKNKFVQYTTREYTEQEFLEVLGIEGTIADIRQDVYTDKIIVKYRGA